MIETISLLGVQIQLYYICWFLSVILAFIVGYAIRKRYDFSFLKCTIYVAFDAVFGVLFLFGTSWLYGGGQLNGINFVRIVPLLWTYFMLLAWLMEDPFYKTFDFLTIVGAFLFIVARLGCIFPGCCHGFPSTWGLYSNEAGTVCFPIQLLEGFVSTIIVIVLIHMSKKPKYQGKIYPYYLIMFGGTRFILEFFRDNEKLFFHISELAVHALAALLLGLGILGVINQKNNRGFRHETQ